MTQYYNGYSPPIAMLANNWQPHLPEYPCILQYKLDGVRAFISPEGKVYLARKGTELIPLRNQFGVPHVWVDGELYIPGKRLQYIAGLCNRLKPDNETIQLEFHAFDIVGSAPQGDRLTKMMYVIANLPRVLPVSTLFAGNPWKATVIYNKLDPDIEGLIYRHVEAPYQYGRTNYLLKRKRLQTDEYKCVGVAPGMGKFFGTLGAFTCVLDDGKTQFNVSAAELTDEERHAMWEDPPFGKYITVRYPSKSAANIPLQAQFVAIREGE
jgi:DNA ligase-1